MTRALPDGGAETLPAQDAAPGAAPPGETSLTPAPVAEKRPARRDRRRAAEHRAKAPHRLCPRDQECARIRGRRRRARAAKPPNCGSNIRISPPIYAARDYAPLWVKDGKPIAAVAGVKARLALAGDDGLSLAGIPQADFSGDSDHLAAAEIAFSEEIVAYGRQASGVRIDPQDINPLIGAKPDVAAPGLILGAVAAAELDGGQMLQSFNPQQKPYLALRAKLIALRPQSRDSVASQSIPPGPSLKLGMTDPRVPLIRARFGLDVVQGDADLIYDTQVATAVADFQKANGLRPSGIFTPRTHGEPRGRAEAGCRERNHRQYGSLALDAAQSRPEPHRCEHSRFRSAGHSRRRCRPGQQGGRRQAEHADADLLQHDEISRS